MTSTARCDFCNSLSHKTRRCNSNMNGRRTMLDGMINCMVRTECPDFNSFPINELRYIAHNYALYEKTTWPHDHMGNKFNRKYSLQPIPLTLSKNRLVRALVERWTGFAPVRELIASPPEIKDCPICYENMFMYNWCQRTSTWIERCVYTYGAKYESPVLLNTCKHLFCGRCWGAHTDQNKKFDAWQNRPYVNCPMCRAKVYCQS